MRPEAVTHAGAADTVTNGDGQEPERRELSIHDADSDSTSLSLSLPTPPASMTSPTLTPPLSIYRVSPTPSSASSSSSRAPVPFFPSVTQPSYIDPGRLAAVPDRPTGRTTFSEALASQPLRPWHASARFDSGVQDQIDCGLQDGQDLATQDPYLFPRLTKNERDRLTAFWYYTRNLQQDRPFLAHLRETLDLVQELIPYDTIILGIMDQDVYTRLVATHVPLAILPRREATCAHTINQPSGMTLSLPDMPADPRFARSPHVAEAGLVSYVGASLRFSISRENGEPQEVVLGTLCAANFTAGHDLSPLQQRALVRFADMIVHEIIERARNVRATERHFMASRLTSISNEVNAANAVDVVLGSLREAYPDVDVSIQHRPDDSILLNGIGPVPYHKFKHYLYEDTAQIEASILACNHLPPDALPNTRTLRAIAIKRSAVPHTYLVMQSARLTHIFDDIDAAFAHSCALVLCNVHQAAELERATAARSAFLRGVSHELRTPIHALLSSCELLVEDARTARHKLSAQFAAGGGKGAEEHATLLENAIASGRQLMATVNNLLNVDALGALVPAPAPFALAALEAALISQVGTTLRGRGGGVQVVCEHLLPPDVHVLVSDFDLLKQALTALLDNAIAFTTSGTITLRTALEGGDDTHLGALVFDVVDTGHGIATEVQASLFDAPQKGSGGGDGTSSAVGLGLAVARRITDALGGALDLRHSNANGSSFRLRLEAPVLACQRGHPARRVAQSKRLRTFAITAAPDGARTAGLRAALAATGLEETTQRTASVLIVDAGVVPPLQGEQVALMLHAEDAVPVSSPRMVPVVEPICAEVLWAALGAVLDLCEQDGSMVSSPSSSISTCASPSASVLTHSTMSSAAYSAVPAPTRATLKILIVDDNRTNLDILCMYSRRRGFPHLSALDGSLAFDEYTAAVAEGAPPTLVLMDLQMPVTDGADATRLIREFEAAHGLRPCLIYMVSGQSSDTDKRRAVEAGADGYYVKPLSLRTLDGLIDLHFPRS